MPDVTGGGKGAVQTVLKHQSMAVAPVAPVASAQD